MHAARGLFFSLSISSSIAEKRDDTSNKLMILTDEILHLLISDKVSERKNARNHVESLLSCDKLFEVITNKEYSQLLRNSIIFESKELKSCLIKKKSCDLSNALLFKSICKHVIKFGEISISKTNELLKHLLVVINDEAVNIGYKNIYIEIFTDAVFTSKCSQSITEENLILIFESISVITLNVQKGLSINLVLKLVRSFCKALIFDLTDENFLRNLFEWLNKFLNKSVDSNEYWKYVNTVCDCYSDLLEYHGINHYNIFLKYIRYPLQKAIQVILSHPFNTRESMIRFIDNCLIFMDHFDFHLLEFLDTNEVTILSILQSILDIILSESFNRSFCIYLNGMNKYIGKEANSNSEYLSDKKINQSVNMASRCIALHHKYTCSYIKSNSHTFRPEQEVDTPLNKKTKHNDLKNSIMVELFHSLRVESSSTESTCELNANTLKYKTSNLLDYNLILIINIFQIKRENVFELFSFKSHNLSNNLILFTVNDWLKLLLDLLKHLSYKLNEVQTNCLVIELLCEIGNICFVQFKDDFSLSPLWFEFVNIIFKQESYFQFLRMPKNNYISTCIIKLLRVVLSYNLLSITHLSSVALMLKKLPWIIDPSLIENLECMNFLASITNSLNHEILPDDIIRNSFLTLPIEFNEESIIKKTIFKYKSLFHQILYLKSVMVDGGVKFIPFGLLDFAKISFKLIQKCFFVNLNQNIVSKKNSEDNILLKNDLKIDNLKDLNEDFWFDDDRSNLSARADFDFDFDFVISPQELNEIFEPNFPQVGVNLKTFELLLLKLNDLFEEYIVKFLEANTKKVVESHSFSSLIVGSSSLMIFYFHIFEYGKLGITNEKEDIIRMTDKHNIHDNFWRLNLEILTYSQTHDARTEYILDFLRVIKALCTNSLNRDPKSFLLVDCDLKSKFVDQILNLILFTKQNALNKSSNSKSAFEFDENETKSSIINSTLNNDSDESFFEDMDPNPKSKVSSHFMNFESKKNKKSRLVLNSDNMSIITLAGQVFLLLNTNHQHYDKILGMNTSSGWFQDIWLSIEFRLKFCLNLSELSHTIDLFYYINSKPWHKYYGNLGYSKVLECICKLTSSPDFFDPIISNVNQETLEAAIKNCTSLVFLDHDLNAFLTNTFWEARKYQLIAASNLAKYMPDLVYTDKSGISLRLKDKFGQIISSYLSDSDIRVRLEACFLLPNLFSMFSKHLVMFDSMIKSQIDGSELTDIKNVPFWNFVTLIVSLTIMCMTSATLKRKSVNYLLYYCSSAIKINTNKFKIDFINSLLFRAFKSISRKCKYSSPRGFFIDNHQWLVFDWINNCITIPNSSNTKDKSNSARIEDFHYTLFEFKSSLTFTSDCANMFIPILCRVEPQNLRWYILLDVCKILNYGQQDSSLAMLIKENLSQIKAVEIVINNYEGLASTNMQEQANYLKSFIERSVSKHIISAQFLEFYSDLVINIFSHFCFESVIENQLNAIENYSTIERSMAQSLEFVASVIIKDDVDIDKKCEILLNRCNLHDLLFIYHSRSLSTISDSVQCGILAGISVLTKYALPFSVHYVMLFVLSNMSRNNKTYLGIICKLFNQMTVHIINNFTDSLKQIVELMFCENYFILLLLKIVLSKKDVNKFLKLKTDKLFGFSYINLKKNILSLSISEQKSIEAILNHTIKIIYLFFHQTNFNTLILPIIAHSTYLFDEDLSSLIGEKTGCLIDVILKFPGKMNILFDYYPVPFSYIWLHVTNLCILLDTEQEITSRWLWYNHKSDVSYLISILLELFSSNQQNLKVLYDDFFYIFGYLGTDDFRSLKHIELPFTINDPYSQNLIKVIDIKSKIFNFTYKLIWDESDQISAYAKSAITEVTASRELLNALNIEFSANFFTESHFRNDYSKFISLDIVDAQQCIFSSEVWDIKPNTVYEAWISSIVYNLLIESSNSLGTLSLKCTDKFLTSFKDVAFLNSTLSEMLFPLICHDIITNYGVVSEQSNFIANKLTQVMLSTNSVKYVPQAAKLAIKVLNFLLRQDINEFIIQSTSTSNKRGDNNSNASNKLNTSANEFSKESSLSQNIHPFNDFLPFGIQLNIDYFQISIAALNCGCICSALMFLELNLESKRFKIYDSELIYKLNEETDVLHKVFLSSHDFDAIYAINQSTNLEIQGSIFSHNDQWIEALSTYESIIQSSQETSECLTPSIAQALTCLGCEHILSDYLNNNSTKYENLTKWNDDKVSFFNDNKKITVLNSLSYQAIQSIKDDDIFVKKQLINSCMNTISKELTHVLSNESAKHLVLALNSCQLLHEVNETMNINHSDDISLIDKLINNWSTLFGKNIFESQTILKNRFIILSNLIDNGKCEPSNLLKLIGQTIDFISSKPHAHAMSPLIYKVIAKLKSFEDFKMSELSKIELYYLESKLYWKKELFDDALSHLKNNVIKPLNQTIFASTLSKNLKTVQLKKLFSNSLITGGEWMDCRKAASSIEILENYFKLAINFTSDNNSTIQTSIAYANFNAKLYNEALMRTESQEWSQSANFNEFRRKEIEECDKIYRELCSTSESKKKNEDKLRTILRHKNVISKELDNDLSDRKTFEQSISIYLINALERYSNVLELSNNIETESVFKVINLWFSNINNSLVNDLIKKMAIKSVSYKLIPLTYQIFSRIGSDMNVSFNNVLTDIVLRMLQDHPYHTLPILYALANEDKMGNYVGAAQYKSKISNERITSAKNILQRLKSKTHLVSLVDSMNHLLTAFNDLAIASTSEQQKKGQLTKISYKEIQPRGSTFLDNTNKLIQNVSTKPFVITSPLSLRSDANYTNHVVYIHEYVDKFSITDSGVSRPKIIECRGSDGVLYKQLVKGGDDMRQDAVMQQVFQHVNLIFQQHDATRIRCLTIRTYKIIPLSPQTGVIEWVNNTIPFGSYLLDSKSSLGAHTRYFPNDWSNFMCREALKNAPDKLHQAFLEIYKNFHPAFRFFFLEKFSDPKIWMSSRLTFTRSVATTSIVGWILGIGDRHSQNILIDQSNAEVVHIDFGIVFEQGKSLGIPETVPFRLTRDIVDGFGITSCEGTFRKSCEKVLEVLKEKMNQVLTILEVVIHDPLYKWSLSPVEVNKHQRKRDLVDDLPFFPLKLSKNDIDLQSGSEKEAVSSNFQKDAANRMLMRIRNKLQGFDDQSFSTLSVEGFVQLLITEAQNTKNLSKLYSGWAPWL